MAMPMLGGALYGFQRGLDDGDSLWRQRANDDFNRAQAVRRFQQEEELFPLRRDAAKQQLELGSEQLTEHRALRPFRERAARTGAESGELALGEARSTAERNRRIRELQTGHDEATRAAFAGNSPQPMLDWISSLNPTAPKLVAKTTEDGFDVAPEDGSGKGIRFSASAEQFGAPAGVSAFDKFGIWASTFANPQMLAKITEKNIERQEAINSEARKHGYALSLENARGAHAIERADAVARGAAARGEPARDLAGERAMKQAVDKQLAVPGQGFVSVAEPRLQPLLGFMYQRANQKRRAGASPTDAAAEAVAETKHQYQDGIRRLTAAQDAATATRIAQEYLTIGWPREAVTLMVGEADNQRKLK